MTTWTEIPTTELDQDSPVTQPLMVSVRDNFNALAEAATDAPVVVSGWHPYDMTHYGDGSGGLIYDFAVDGAVLTVETPAFVAGYEYAILFSDFSHSSGLVQDLLVDALRNSDTTWVRLLDLGTSITPGAGVSGRVEIYNPTMEEQAIVARGIYATNPAINGTEAVSTFYDADYMDKARIWFTAGNLDAGKVWLFKRGAFPK